MSTTKMSIHERLHLATKAVGHIKKEGVNGYDHYSYQKWEDIMLEIRNALNSNGLTMDVSISGPPERTTYQGSSGTRMINCIVPLTITFYSVDGDHTSSTWSGEGSDRGDKSLGKAITAGVKSYLQKKFLIPVEPDGGEPDKESPVHEGEEQSQSSIELMEKAQKALSRADDLDKIEKLREWFLRQSVAPKAADVFLKQLEDKENGLRAKG